MAKLKTLSRGTIETMTVNRFPFWVTPTELETLNTIVFAELEKNNQQVLSDICSELSVAKTRFDNTRFKKGLLPKALGLDEEMIPIRLSNEEKEVLLGLAQIPKALRERLV
jgi:hypothetical protein